MKYKRYPAKRKTVKTRKRSGRRQPASRRATYLYLAATVCLFLGFAVYALYIVGGLPSLNQLDNPRSDYATKVYSADGMQIGEYLIVNRSRISRGDLPPYLVAALIASEDRKFYRHNGIDYTRIAGATVRNIRSMRIREGASTITQQVARNLYLSHEQSFTRKIREAITAIQIENRYSKDEILEFYFNLAYFGNSTYGVAAASRRYFDKDPSELTLNESALLVGILPNPSAFDPYRHPDRATIRRNIVLRSMYAMENISADVLAAASGLPLGVGEHAAPLESQIAPHFVEHVRQELSDLSIQYGFDVYRDGLTVITTLDSRLQRHANNAVTGHANRLQRRFDVQWNWDAPANRPILKQALNREVRSAPAYRNAESDDERDSVRVRLLNDDVFVAGVKRRLQTVQTGFVAIDPSTGKILAMVGGSDYRNNAYGLNHATQIRRQPGSAFKPFVYTVAIDNGYLPSYELPNDPVTVTTTDGSLWTPANNDGSTGGNVSLREGLAQSVNLIAVRALVDIAPLRQVIQYAHRMGIQSHIPPFESISLGTAEVSPLELTAAYGVFAANGMYAEPYAIQRVVGGDGTIIIDRSPYVKKVLKPETAYIMTDMMRDVIEYGTGAAAKSYIDFPAAGKTGTTQGYADGWFIGYTPEIVAGVWVGFGDRRMSLGASGGPGSRSALPIWALFMSNAYEDEIPGLRKRDFPMPAGVVRVDLCGESKMLAAAGCPHRIDEIVPADHRVKECDKHRSFMRSVRTFFSRIFN